MPENPGGRRAVCDEEPLEPVSDTGNALVISNGTWRTSLKPLFLWNGPPLDER